MRRKINPTWIANMKEKLSKAKNFDRSITFEPEIISYNPSAQWLISAIASRGFIPKVENLGAGVKRVGIKGSCCKLCGAVIK